MLDKLSPLIRKKDAELNLWFQERAKGVRLPVTTSVDIRNAGFKIAVVDTNVFPAGFNNLCNNFSKMAAENFRKYFDTHLSRAKKILIIPEAFTRNLNYLEHLHALEKLLKLGGFDVAFGFLGEPLPSDPFEVSLPSGAKLRLHQLKRKGSRVEVAGFEPDGLLLNNDCSGGIPDILQNLSQPIFPSPHLGWHARSKKHHFEIYCQLAEEMGKILEIDCWRLCPVTYCERNVDVDKPEDLERLAKRVERVLEKTQKKYEEYSVKEKPYVFIKNNAGTFGLGLAHVSSPEEVLNLNRKGRQKLSTSKGGGLPTEFIIQEGILTIDSFEGSPIEPVLYFVGGESVGGFFRIHEQKDDRASLNAPGARYECLCFHKIKEQKSGELILHCKDHEDFFTVAKWLGKIASLAAGLEEQSLQSA